MKKTLLTILAIATILAITIIPASALSVAPDVTKENWVAFINSEDEDSANEYVKVESEYKFTKVMVLKSVKSENAEVIDVYDSSIKGFNLKMLYFCNFCYPAPDGDVYLYIQNDDNLTPYMLDKTKIVDASDWTSAVVVPKYESVKLETPDGANHTFIKIAVNTNNSSVFFGQEVEVEPEQNKGFVGSVFASEPVWGIIIVALMLGCFAGGTAFGKKKNKAD